MIAHTKRGTVARTPRVISGECNDGKGEVYSLKMGKIITCKTQIEQDFLYLLDYDAAVETFRPRPFNFEIPAPNQRGAKSRWPERDETWVRYSPDFAIDIAPPLPPLPGQLPGERRRRRAKEYADVRALLVDVVSSAHAATPAARQLFDTLTSWCRDRTYGLEFLYTTDRDMRAGCYLANVKVLREFAHHIVQPQTRTLIHALLEANPNGMPIGDIALAINSLALDDAVGSILHMAYHHEVVLPIGDWMLSSQTRAYSPCHRHNMPTTHTLENILRKEA